MSQSEELYGTVEKLLFQNDQNGFTVFSLQINKNNLIVVRGYLPTIHPGEHVQINGSWVVHPKFGKQFEAQSCSTQVPTSILGLKKYLSSGLIKGIGPVYAEKLVQHFGINVLEVIDKEPSRLYEVPGFGTKRVQTIIIAWQDQKEISHVMVFLQEKGISPTYATKIYKRYGSQSIEVLTENPYRLADDIWGIGFKIADQIAKNMGIEPDSIKRIRSGLLFCLSTIISNGHLYIEINALKQQAIQLLELEPESAAQKLKQALHDLHDTEKIKVITHNDVHYVSLSQYYFSEKGVARNIKELLKYPTPHQFNIDIIYQSLRVGQGIELNEEQQRGILTCLQQKVTIITGGPGTGKTTLIKSLLTILEHNKKRYSLAAPTGRAAKRISDSTHRNAQTIHRLLEFDVGTMGFTRNDRRALDLDFLIIDEASMIDIFLANAILKALPLNAHVVFIGDVDQLPSVGAGNFLHDIIASEQVPCIRLTHIFRQAQDSLIIINAHRINHGEFPCSYQPNARRDFLFIKEQEPANVPAHLEHIIHKGLPTYGIAPEESIVLVPMNRGTVGTQKLNDTLQHILNPKQTENQIIHTGTLFKIGDRVMQLRNNYDKLVFNGDIGTIETIDTTERTFIIRYLERPVEYDFSELDELALAYAISIHKSQGSEYAAVIIPIFMQHFMLLQRNLIYTAITRAKKLCIFIGQPQAIALAIKNNKGSERTTFLKEFLTSDLQCR
ncbi:MAG: ATP-dependent RecD-like DNA helicase [bacterium]|nr:ATP-dependent RecD-like DNA helicase [bacterium]